MFLQFSAAPKPFIQAGHSAIVDGQAMFPVLAQQGRGIKIHIGGPGCQNHGRGHGQGCANHDLKFRFAGFGGQFYGFGQAACLVQFDIDDVIKAAQPVHII